MFVHRDEVGVYRTMHVHVLVLHQADRLEATPDHDVDAVAAALGRFGGLGRRFGLGGGGARAFGQGREQGVDALSVRIGEGGGAYNEETGYASTVLVTTASSVSSAPSPASWWCCWWSSSPTTLFRVR